VSKTTAWILHLAVSAMAVTGFWLTWILWFAGPPAETELEMFAVADDWQSWLTAVHIVAGPVLVFAIGFIWHRHVWPRIQFPNARRRRSGVLLLFLFGPLVLGGYALQVVETDAIRDALSWTHAAAGGLFALGYAVHLILRPPPDGNLQTDPHEA
jgi:hypothetical protein